MDQPLLQPYLALCFLYCGILMGIVYGLFDLLRNVFTKTFLQHVIDGICAVTLGCIFFCTSFVTMGGALRLYPFLLSALGFYIEQRTIHMIFLTKHSKRIHKTKSQYE